MKNFSIFEVKLYPRVDTSGLDDVTFDKVVEELFKIDPVTEVENYCALNITCSFNQDESDEEVLLKLNEVRLKVTEVFEKYNIPFESTQ